MEHIIKSYYSKKLAEQKKVDCEGIVYNKKGRPSSFTYMKSHVINKWLHNLIKNKIQAIIIESKATRADLFTTEYLRAIK